jgi:hypothetical protein
MLAWFFLLVTMTWQGAVTTAYIGPFPSEAACQVMRERTALRVMQQQWVETATVEGCQLQEPK